MTTAPPARVNAASKLVAKGLAEFFRCELANERNGGVSPSTVSSAIESLSQAPADAFGMVQRSDLIDLLMIVVIVGTDTELADLL